jgi:hypothetical protein
MADAVAMLILATSASAQSRPRAAAPQRALDELADWGAQTRPDAAVFCPTYALAPTPTWTPNGDANKRDRRAVGHANSRPTKRFSRRRSGNAAVLGRARGDTVRAVVARDGQYRRPEDAFGTPWERHWNASSGDWLHGNGPRDGRRDRFSGSA